MMAEPEEKSEENKLTPEMMHAVFLILLQHAGGSINIPLEVLENYPKQGNFSAKYDEVNKRWYFFIPRKKTRILRPSLYIPN